MMIFINILHAQSIKFRYRYPSLNSKLFSLGYPSLKIQYSGHYTTFIDKDSFKIFEASFDTITKTSYKFFFNFKVNGTNELIIQGKKQNSNKWNPELKSIDTFDSHDRFLGNLIYTWDTIKLKFVPNNSTNFFYHYDASNRLTDSVTGTSSYKILTKTDSTHYEYNSKTNKLLSATFSIFKGKKSYLQFKNDSFVFDTINNKRYYIHKEYKNYLSKWQSNYIMTRTWNGKDYIDQKDSLDLAGNKTSYSFKEQYYAKDDSIIYTQTDGGNKYFLYGAASFNFPVYSGFYHQKLVSRSYDYDTITKVFKFVAGNKTTAFKDKTGKIIAIANYYGDSKGWGLNDSTYFSYDSTYVSAIPNSTIDNPYFISIYPNPAQNQINLNIHSVTNSSKPLTIQMIDNLGNQVQVLQNVKANSTNLIDIQNLSTGMYHLNIFDGTKQVSSKTLMKE